MPLNYRISKVEIRSFRGIDSVDLNIHSGFPNVLIGANNAGKSTILNAIALALGGGGSHQWKFSERDFYCQPTEDRRRNFSVKVYFESSSPNELPAVQGVGKPLLIQGAQAKGVLQKNGKIRVTQSLFGLDGNTVTYSTSTPIPKVEKQVWADHDIGYRKKNARLGDIYSVSPEVWFFTPQNIEASLYVWKTGPIAKLAKLLAQKFLSEKWEMTLADGSKKQMPATLHRAHEFFQQSVEAFPFWENDMKPKLETTFKRYVGSNAKIDLRPDIKTLEDWLAQQLAIDLATDPNSLATPLKDMGDGWQSVIRLAALEALSQYPDIMRERVVLLIEEPETHLHPHLRRRMQKVLGELSSKGWTIIYTTHSSEMISFEGNQTISRLVRNNGSVISSEIKTDEINDAAKLQSKLDANGSHDFLFSTATVFCEGKSDKFALAVGLEIEGLECDARSISISQCGSISAIPAFVKIASSLGISWCAVTDEDVLADGTINPITGKVREDLEGHKTDNDKLVQWAGDLEKCLNVTEGKAKPEVTISKTSDANWKTLNPNYFSTISSIATWIDPERSAS